MNTLRWSLAFTLALACSSSDEPEPDALPRGGSAGTVYHDGGAAGVASGAPDSGVTPASAGSAGLVMPECAARRRRYFEERGFLAAGSVRGLLDALDEPEAFWNELPTCSTDQ